MRKRIGEKAVARLACANYLRRVRVFRSRPQSNGEAKQQPIKTRQELQMKSGRGKTHQKLVAATCAPSCSAHPRNDRRAVATACVEFRSCHSPAKPSKRQVCPVATR